MTTMQAFAPPSMAAVVAALVAAVGAGFVAVHADWRLACTLAIAGGLAALALRIDPPSPATVTVDAPPRWVGQVLPVAWVATTLLPGLRLFGGASRGVDAASGGNASVDNLVQLAAAMSVIGVMLLVLRSKPRIVVPPTVVLFLVYPGLAILSVAWTRLPIYTAGRAVELLAVACMAVLLIWVAGPWNPVRGGWVMHRVIQVYISAVLPLIVWMYVTPNHRDGRLEWPGGHPNVSGEVIALAVLLLFANPRRRFVRYLPVTNWMLGGALLVVQIQVHSRGSTLAMLAGLVAIQTVRGARNTRVGAMLVGAATVSGGLIALLAWDKVLDFVLRDQSIERVLGANGRRNLWNDILRDPLGNEVWGLGMGAARDLIPADWAGDAHSAWIDLLLSLGVIGLGVVVAVFIAVSVGAVRRWSPISLGLLAFAAVLGTNYTAFHEPSVAMGALLLSLPYLYIGDPAEVP